MPTVAEVPGNAGIDHVYITYTNVIGGLNGLQITDVDTSNLSSREVILHWEPLPRVTNYTLNVSTDLENWIPVPPQFLSQASSLIPKGTNGSVTISYPGDSPSLYVRLIVPNSDP